MTTAELSMSFLRPVVPKPGTAVTGSGQLIHRGRTMGISEAFLFDDDDELISHGTTRCSVFPPVDPIPDPPDPDAPPIDQAPPGSAERRPAATSGRGRVAPPGGFRAARRAWRSSGTLIAGELPRPPIHHLTGLGSIEAEEGETVGVLPCSKWLSTSAGTVQGGFTAMLAEFAMTAGRLQHRAAPHRGRGSRLQGQLPAAGLPRRERPDRESTDPPSGADAGDRRRRDHSTPRASRSRWPRARRCTCRAGPPTWSASSSAPAPPIPRTTRAPSDTVGPWASSAS